MFLLIIHLFEEIYIKYNNMIKLIILIFIDFLSFPLGLFSKNIFTSNPQSPKITKLFKKNIKIKKSNKKKLNKNNKNKKNMKIKDFF